MVSRTIRPIPLLFLAVFLVIPVPISAQTYGSGEPEQGGIFLRFYGQVTSGGECQVVGQDKIQCQIPAGTSGTLRLTATGTPHGTVNICAVSLSAGWVPFPVASGWGSINRQYGFTVPSSSAGKQFELHFGAWTAGVVGEL